MRGLILGAATALALAGCGSSSTLSTDDQELCGQQEARLAAGRDAVEEMIDGDRHWSSDAEPLAVAEAAIRPSYTYLTSRTPQDEELARLADEAGKAMLSVSIAMPDKVFDGDAQVARDARALLDELQAFCDENG